MERNKQRLDCLVREDREFEAFSRGPPPKETCKHWPVSHGQSAPSIQLRTECRIRDLEGELKQKPRKVGVR